MIDIHSHILPGVDDGAEALADTVAMIRELAMAGVTDIVATPHYIFETSYAMPAKTNEEILAIVRKAVERTGVRVNLYLGNEIYIDKRILRLLELAAVKPLAESRYLLIELPMNGKFEGAEDIFKELMEKGYKVILAHPERYAKFQKDFAGLEKLHEMGILFQCNIGSILGQYGKKVEKLVRRLAKQKWIFAFGSDIHHPSRAEYLERLEARKARTFLEVAKERLLNYYSEMELEQVLVENPREILKK